VVVDHLPFPMPRCLVSSAFPPDAVDEKRGVGRFLKGPHMGKKLYVGNLSYSVTDHSLQDTFGAFGSVQSAKVMTDRDSGRSKGFGFVEMSSDAEAQAAISGMNGKSVEGRDMVVNEARPMEPRSGGGGGGYGGGRGNY
jgi:RNA recognition motif-containing protein